jgi:hypothetical protein
VKKRVKRGKWVFEVKAHSIVILWFTNDKTSLG